MAKMSSKSPNYSTNRALVKTSLEFQKICLKNRQNGQKCNKQVQKCKEFVKNLSIPMLVIYPKMGQKEPKKGRKQPKIATKG